MVRRHDGAVLLACEDGARRRGLWKLPERSAEVVADLELLATHTYSITHHRVRLHVHACPAGQVPPAPAGAPPEDFQPPEKLATLPMPSPFRRALERLL